MSNTVLQYKTRARQCQLREGKALTFKFELGPLKIFIIAHLPVESNEEPIVYVKAELRIEDDWEFYGGAS